MNQSIGASFVCNVRTEILTTKLIQNEPINLLQIIATGHGPGHNVCGNLITNLCSSCTLEKRQEKIKPFRFNSSFPILQQY